MNEVALQALRKLFKLGDKVTAGGRTTTLLLNERSFPDYLMIKDSTALSETHAVFSNAVKYGAISVDWVKFQEGNQIKRIRLTNLERLASFLQKDTLSARVNNAIKVLIPCENLAPEWLQGIYKDIVCKWKKGNRPFNLSPEDARIMCDIITLVDYLESSKNELDMRTVSVRLYQDTKYLENRILSRIISIYRHHFALVNASDEEILAEISLSKYPWPVLIRGELDVIPNRKSEPVIYCGVKPYIGIPPDSIQGVKARSVPDYVLTIENFSTFNTYSRQINDGGIIIYTNGFPNKWLASFYKDILSHTGDKVPVYHWGDIDVGGFRILAKLQEYARSFNIPVLPHLMSPSPSQYGKLFSDSEKRELKKIDSINDEADKVLSTLQTDGSMKVEQESINPISPLHSK